MKVTSSFFRFGELPKEKKKRTREGLRIMGKNSVDAWIPSSLSDEGQTQGQS